METLPDASLLFEPVVVQKEKLSTFSWSCLSSFRRGLGFFFLFFLVTKHFRFEQLSVKLPLSFSWGEVVLFPHVWTRFSAFSFQVLLTFFEMAGCCFS